jgi:hypothetical protein
MKGSWVVMGLSFYNIILHKNLTPALSYLGEGAKSPPDIGGIKGGRFAFVNNYDTIQGNLY